MISTHSAPGEKRMLVLDLSRFYLGTHVDHQTSTDLHFLFSSYKPPTCRSTQLTLQGGIPEHKERRVLTLSNFVHVSVLKGKVIKYGAAVYEKQPHAKKPPEVTFSEGHRIILSLLINVLPFLFYSRKREDI